MKGTHRRGIGSASGSRLALAATITMAAGCGAASTPSGQKVEAPGKRAAAAAPSTQQGRPLDADTRAQSDAQVAWCGYLEELYLRSAEAKGRWPKLRQCTEARTTVAARMLRQTTDCARRALDAFSGDPFTDAYAMEVSRCGVIALSACAVSRVEIAPFVDSICSRAVSCGRAAADCAGSFDATLALNLERAVGALNQPAREQLRSCLVAAPCGEMAEQIAGCLEPVMDQLLWVPD